MTTKERDEALSHGRIELLAQLAELREAVVRAEGVTGPAEGKTRRAIDQIDRLIRQGMRGDEKFGPLPEVGMRVVPLDVLAGKMIVRHEAGAVSVMWPEWVFLRGCRELYVDVARRMVMARRAGVPGQTAVQELGPLPVYTDAIWLDVPRIAEGWYVGDFSVIRELRTRSEDVHKHAAKLRQMLCA